MLINVLAAEGSLSSASNVDKATVVRLLNNHSAALLITRKTAGGDTIGSLTADNGKVRAQQDSSLSDRNSSMHLIEIAG